VPFVSLWHKTSTGDVCSHVGDWVINGPIADIAETTFLTDAVEKVGRTFGICAFGGFDAAEPAVGFYGRWIGGGGSMQTQLT